MQKIQAVSVFAGLALLAACAPLTSQGRVEALQRAQPTGSNFTQRLAQEYRDLAVFEQKEMYDYIDAGYFADKGMRAARGEAVPPEDPSNWRIPQNRIGELQSARSRLTGLLDAGAREQQAEQAAKAQVKYDCWVEQQEENWQVDDIAACRGEFLQAMAQLAPPAPAVTTQQQYLVFFDWDRSEITAGGAQVLDTVARDFRARGITSVTVVGHADLSGPPGYNQRLSERRSAAVRQGLAQRGIPTNAIRTAGRGEAQPMVPTPDGVREPANRRAEIRFQ